MPTLKSAEIPKKLWVCKLSVNYMQKSPEIPKKLEPKNGSWLWRGLYKIWHFVRKEIAWVILYGKSVCSG